MKIIGKHNKYYATLAAATAAYNIPQSPFRNKKKQSKINLHSHQRHRRRRAPQNFSQEKTK
jgi:hypothetical protein